LVRRFVGHVDHASDGEVRVSLKLFGLEVACASQAHDLGVPKVSALAAGAADLPG